jgi:hypothetical protein
MGHHTFAKRAAPRRVIGLWEPHGSCNPHPCFHYQTPGIAPRYAERDRKEHWCDERPQCLSRLKDSSELLALDDPWELSSFSSGFFLVFAASQ